MNIVEQINDAITARIGTVLGAPYQELNYIISVNKNNFKSNAKRYGVKPLEASTVSTITRVYTLDHVFEILLTHDYIPNPANDQDQRDKTFLLYDKMDEIFSDLFCSKAGLNNIILNINELNMAEPEYSVSESVVVLRSKITVKYRQALV